MKQRHFLIESEDDLRALEVDLSLDWHDSKASMFREIIDIAMSDAEMESVTIQFPISLLPPTYQTCMTAFAKHVGKGLKCIVDGSKRKSTGYLRAGYTSEPKTFMGKLVAKLQNPRVNAVTLKKSDLPESWQEQPYHLAHRLKQKGIAVKIFSNNPLTTTIRKV